MIHIICHRGMWSTIEEQNTLTAFEKALDAGFGIEIDVRDYNRQLVISHDPPHYSQSLESFIQLLGIVGDRPNIIAVNVKSSGLAPYFFRCHKPKNWFFFDVVEAEVDEYNKHGLPVYKTTEWGEPALIISPEIYKENYKDKWQYYHKVEQDICLITDLWNEAREYFRDKSNSL